MAEIHSRSHLALWMRLLWPLALGYHASFPLEEGCCAYLLLQLSAAFVFRQKYPVSPILCTCMGCFNKTMAAEMAKTLQKGYSPAETYQFSTISKQSCNDYSFQLRQWCSRLGIPSCCPGHIEMHSCSRYKSDLVICIQDHLWIWFEWLDYSVSLRGILPCFRLNWALSTYSWITHYAY